LPDLFGFARQRLVTLDFPLLCVSILYTVGMYILLRGLFLVLFTSTLFSTPTELPPADDTLQPAKPPAGVDIVEKLGNNISQFKFFDETGKEVTLASLNPAGKPVIFTPVYYNCPHLCTLTLNGLSKAIERESRLKLGKDYLVISYSIHPEEKSGLAQKKQGNYLRKLPFVSDENLKEYESSWRFLTGTGPQIMQMSQAIGFQFQMLPTTNIKKQSDEYVHPAVILVLTPSMKVSRYLYGTDYPEVDFRLSLIEASEGKISSISDKILLTCYSFDPVKRKYSLVAWRVMRLGGFVTGILLLGLLVTLWIRDRRKRAKNIQ